MRIWASDADRQSAALAAYTKLPTQELIAIDDLAGIPMQIEGVGRVTALEILAALGQALVTRGRQHGPHN